MPKHRTVSASLPGGKHTQFLYPLHITPRVFVGKTGTLPTATEQNTKVSE